MIIAHHYKKNIAIHKYCYQIRYSIMDLTYMQDISGNTIANRRKNILEGDEC